MKDHLGNERIIGYIHYTLTDAERETMDEHFETCPECRMRLTDYEAMQRRIRYSLSADIRVVSPSPNMTYASIAPRLERRRWWAGLGAPSHQLVRRAAAFAVVAGLVVALLSLFDNVRWSSAGTAAASANRLSMLACGCFAVAAMGNYGWQAFPPPRMLLTKLLALALWIGTAIVGLQVIVTVLDILTWLLYLGVSSSITGLAGWVVIPLSLTWIAVVVGGGEYHFERLGQRVSWRLFGVTVAVELLILSLPYLLGIWFSLPPIWR